MAYKSFGAFVSIFLTKERSLISYLLGAMQIPKPCPNTFLLLSKKTNP